MKIPPKTQNTKKATKLRVLLTFFAYAMASIFGFCLLGLSFFVIHGWRVVGEQPHVATLNEVQEEVAPEYVFPVGVYPAEKKITERSDVDTYFNEYITPNDVTAGQRTSWVHKAFGKLALMDWYQNLASLSSRILVIESGERKEQVAENFGTILKWSKPQKAEFLSLIQSQTPALEDGKFYPGTYTVSRGATPAEVAPLVVNRFRDEVLSKYTEEVSAVVPIVDALTIASLLEREAYDFEDMRHISGVIWNRLFTDMRLQIDATLQYVKGSNPDEPWWPRVVPADKYLTSAYNTYKNEGLPPTPIANPSLAAILAALNPTETECMYYFHDRKAQFHCSKTYEEHVSLLKQYYGQGK